MDETKNEVLGGENKNETSVLKFAGDNYPYETVEDTITDFDSLELHGVMYEIKCLQCELSIRSQGCNIKRVYERLLNGVQVKNQDGSIRIEGGKGCIGCGSRNFIVKKVNMTKKSEVKANRKINAD